MKYFRSSYSNNNGLCAVKQDLLDLLQSSWTNEVEAKKTYRIQKIIHRKSYCSQNYPFVQCSKTVKNIQNDLWKHRKNVTAPLSNRKLLYRWQNLKIAWNWKFVMRWARPRVEIFEGLFDFGNTVEGRRLCKAKNHLLFRVT